MRQLTFASATYGAKQKTTRRERFLAEMNAVMPWKRVRGLIEPYYPKAGTKGGHPVMPLERMVRRYCLQQWFNLSDPGLEEALYDIESMRRFAGVELNDDAIADKTTILNFCHMLERHGLTEKLFSEVQALRSERGLLLREGTLVDATLIDAPSSTKSAQGERDPEMTQTKKGEQWYFGMKAHIGVDAASDLVYTLETTSASVPDMNMTEALLHGEEKTVVGDPMKAHEAGDGLACGKNKPTFESKR